MSAPSPRPPRFHPSEAEPELYCPPSAEADRLRRRFPLLLAPPEGEGPRLHRMVRNVLVAPFTQLSLGSFDLQMFLFDVLHTSVAARATHLIGMAAVNLIVAALLSQLAGTALAAWLYAAVLLIWYGAVAHLVRLLAWWLAMIPVVAALAFAGTLLASASTGLLVLALLLSGLILTLGHAGEPLFPPRAGDPYRWRPVAELVFGPAGQRHSLPATLYWVLRVIFFGATGILNEIWASPRLLPYNILRLLMAAGYAPKLRAVLDDRVRRAWASGNPALDYVGVGGGAFLVTDESGPRSEAEP